MLVRKLTLVKTVPEEPKGTILMSAQALEMKVGEAEAWPKKGWRKIFKIRLFWHFLKIVSNPVYPCGLIHSALFST